MKCVSSPCRQDQTEKRHDPSPLTHMLSAERNRCQETEVNRTFDPLFSDSSFAESKISYRVGVIEDLNNLDGCLFSFPLPLSASIPSFCR